jgi:uncharacterized protein
MALLFRRTKALEARIDNYLDQVVAAGLLFQRGMAFYLKGAMDEAERCISDLDAVESKGDTLRREIEAQLYTETLIPESRGDVLGLIEAIDDVLDDTNESLGRLSVERPLVPPEFNERLADLAEVTVKSVESMVAAVRAYFVDLARVRDHCAKTAFYEKEADQLTHAVKRELFASTTLDLAHKLHLRSIVEGIERISDGAEDVGDRLSIAVIKRYD